MKPPRTLPRNVRRIGDRIYFTWKIAGKRYNRRLPSEDHADFSAACDSAREIMLQQTAARRQRFALPVPAVRAESVKRWNARLSVRADPSRTIPTWLQTLSREARKRARRRGIEHTLTLIDLSMLHERANSRCEISGIAFMFERHAGSLYRPFAPSIDRVDPRAGYTFRNVRLVTVIVNAALNQWGEIAFWKMIDGAAGASRE